MITNICSSFIVTIVTSSTNSISVVDLAIFYIARTGVVSSTVNDILTDSAPALHS